jgi:hypothetical protein
VIAPNTTRRTIEVMRPNTTTRVENRVLISKNLSIALLAELCREQNREPDRDRLVTRTCSNQKIHFDGLSFSRGYACFGRIT